MFFSNGIGDRLLSLPALRALVSLFGPRLTLLCDRAAAPFFRTELAPSRVVEIDHPPGDRRHFETELVAPAIVGCDLFLSLVPWSSEALGRLIRVSGPGFSVGFGPGFDVSLARDYGKHSAELAFDLPRFLDPSLEIDAFAAPLRFDQGVRRRTRRLLAPLPTGARILAVHADTLREKMWPSERMTEVIDRFLADHRDFVVFVVGLSNPTFPGEGARPQVVDGCGLPLDVSMKVVASSDLFLGVDSCMLHAADLARVPGLGLFGPTSSVEFGFRFGPHRHLQAASMNEIAVEEAVTALGDVWSACDERERPRRYRRDAKASVRPLPALAGEEARCQG